MLMNNPTKQSGWQIYLIIAGVIIVLLSLFYSNYLASKIAVEEQKGAKDWLFANQALTDADEEDDIYCDYTLHYQLIANNTSIPVILTDKYNKAIKGKNFGPGKDENLAFLQQEVDKLLESGSDPIQGKVNNLFYKESSVLRQLRFFPIIQLLLISAFVLFGYMGVNAARRAEQNRVWVGLAKETAHQLGTPISAILAWIEHLRVVKEKDDEVTEVLDELTNDVNRLELVADRFSKIGSVPKLKSINVLEELEKCRAYMERRAPRKVSFNFPASHEKPCLAAINPPLFDWVIENLLRNALDAMEGKGEISAKVIEDKSFVNIEISDTGKGIAPNKFKTVFQPGYTTKKRGWGLGLSLAKRIIEEYHSGKIFVKQSTEGVGTTFTIQLPKK